MVQTFVHIILFGLLIWAIVVAVRKGRQHEEIMTNPETLHGECTLDFENYSNSLVDFQLEFYEEKVFPDDVPILSLMNEQGPYNVTIKPRKREVVFVEADIDVSDMEEHIEGGKATGFNIIIRENGKIRKL